MLDADGTAEDGTVQPAPRRRTPSDRYSKTVVFVAPPGTISRALVCAIEAEFPWLAVENVRAPEELAGRASENVKLIVLAHQVCCNNKPAVREIARRYGQAGIAVMVDRTAQFAFRDLPESLPMRGVLPMNVNLDIWLSILRIMLHGGSYLPPELVLPSVFTRYAQGSPEAPQQAHVHSQPATPATAAIPHLQAGPPPPDGNHGQPPKPLQPGIAPLPGRRAAEEEARNGPAGKPAHSPLHALTVRECEVLHMVSRGCQNKIIAAELDLAENTVKIHLHNIIRKLAVSNRTQAAALYLEEIEAGRGCIPETVANGVRRS